MRYPSFTGVKRGLAVGLLAAGAAIGLSVWPALALSTDTTQTPAQVYAAVSPSVVALNVLRGPANTDAAPLPPNRPDVPEGSAATGSGFVMDTAGHIITNAHVVEGATRIEVMFHDGTQTRAEIVGLDESADIAVIRVDLPAAVLTPVRFGDSDALAIGEGVLAIGSPFGQRWTLTEGIVSALDRTIPGLTQFSIGGVIQTDAAINPGNSGGPLLNLAGEVIGVNSQIRSSSGSSAGVGFAVPASLVQRVAADLIRQGFVEYSYLGIQGGDVSLALIEALGLANNFRGVVVGAVAPGGPADRAGLQAAAGQQRLDGLTVPQQVDVIIAINGTPVTGMGDLIGYLAHHTRPGDTVTLDIVRNGRETLQVDALLTPRPR
jgi:2-alkenal reductase